MTEVVGRMWQWLNGGKVGIGGAEAVGFEMGLRWEAKRQRLYVDEGGIDNGGAGSQVMGGSEADGFNDSMVSKEKVRSWFWFENIFTRSGG